MGKPEHPAETHTDMREHRNYTQTETGSCYMISGASATRQANYINNKFIQGTRQDFYSVMG